MAIGAAQARREIEDVAARHADELKSPNFRRSLTLNIHAWADPAHALLELLQNADDAEPASTKSSVSVEYVFRPDALIVSHDGQPFSVDDARGIASIGDSTKSAEKHIGFMGIGFKSVYKFASAAYVRSGEFSFCFEPDNFAGEDFAWVIVPAWCEKFPVPAGRRGRTTFYFPYRDDITDEVKEALESSANEIPEECLLFLNYVSEIRMLSGNQVARTIRRRGDVIEDTTGDATSRRSFRVFRRSFKVPSDCRKAQRVIESHRDKVIERQITLAFELDARGSLRPMTGGASIFAFLPTNERARLPFIVQADFILDAQRSQIDRSLRWNAWMLEKSADILMNDAVGSFKKEPKAKYRFLEILPRLGVDETGFLKKNFLDQVWAACSVSPIVPGVSGKWLRAAEAVLSTKDIQAIVDEPQLRQITDRKGWVNHQVRARQFLRDLGVESFSEGDVLEALWDTDWLQSKPPRWFVKLFTYLQAWWVRVPTETWNSSSGRTLREMAIVPTQAKLLAAPEDAIFPPKQKSNKVLAAKVPGLDLVIPSLNRGPPRRFLLTHGVEEFDLERAIKRAILPGIESGECNDWPVRVREQVLKLLRDWLKSLRWRVPDQLQDVLAQVPLPSTDRIWRAAEELNVRTRRLQRLDPEAKFVRSGKDKDWGKFVQTLGVAPYLRLSKHDGDVSRWDEISEPKNWSEYCGNLVAGPGYVDMVSGVTWLPALDSRLSTDKARILVEMLVEGWPDYYSRSLRSTVRTWNRSRKYAREANSYFAWQLRSRRWLPTTRGLRRPETSVFVKSPGLERAYGAIPAYLDVPKALATRGRPLWEHLDLFDEVTPAATAEVLREASRLKGTNSLRRELTSMYRHVGELLRGLIEDDDDDAYSDWEEALGNSPLLIESGTYDDERKDTYWADDRQMAAPFADEVEFAWFPNDVERSTIAAFLEACSVDRVSGHVTTSLGRIGPRVGDKDQALQSSLSQKKDLLLSCVAHRYPQRKQDAKGLLDNIKAFQRDSVPIVVELGGIKHDAEAAVFFDRAKRRILRTHTATLFDVSLEICRVLGVDREFAETIESVLRLSRPEAIQRLERLGIAGIKFKPSDTRAQIELEALLARREEESDAGLGYAVPDPTAAGEPLALTETQARHSGIGATRTDGHSSDVDAFDQQAEATVPLPDLDTVTAEFVEYAVGAGAASQSLPHTLRLKSVPVDSGEREAKSRADPTVIGDRAERIVNRVEADRLSRQGFDPSEALIWISAQNSQADHDFESLGKAGERIFIEVKAVRSNGRFRWTRNEFVLAQDKRERYFLYLVFNPQTTKPRVVSYADPIGLIGAREMDLDFEVLVVRAPLAPEE